MRLTKAGLLLFAVLCLGVMAQAKDAKPDRDAWYGIYYNQTKIGYLHTTIKKDKYEGKDALRREDVFFLRGCISKGQTQNDIKRVLITDMDCNYIYGSFKMILKGPYNPTGVTLDFEEKYEPNECLTKLTGSDGTNQQGSQPIEDKDKPILKVSGQYDLGKMEIKVGDVVKMNRYYLLDIVLTEFGYQANYLCEYSLLTVVKNENIRVGDKSYDTVLVTETGKRGDVRRWQLKTGEIIKEEVPKNHITFILESKEKATSIEKGDAPDLVKLMKS